MVNIILIAAGLVFLYRKRLILAYTIIVVAVLSLLLLSLPPVSCFLTRSLEKYPSPDSDEISQAQAIVILGAGRDYRAPEFNAESCLSSASLRRLSYGVYLNNKTGIPILVTGGKPYNEKKSEGELMDRALENIFRKNAQWVENKSRNTRENALYSADILKADNIHKIILVSHAWHLARAVPEFEKHGLEVVPGPTEFSGYPEEGIINFIPRAYYLYRSTLAIHEWMGIVVYRVMY